MSEKSTVQSQESKAVIIIQGARLTHVNWLEFLESNPEKASLPKYEYVGSINHQKEYIKEYDYVLVELANIAQLKAELDTLQASRNRLIDSYKEAEADLAAAKKKAETHRLNANGLENGQALLERKLEDMRTVITLAIDGCDTFILLSGTERHKADLRAIKETLEQAPKEKP